MLPMEENETNFEEDKKYFEKAMKEGYIEASFMKTIFIGAGGAGKTHAVCLLRGADPPDPNCRQSTEIARKAITLRVDIASDEKWEEIDTEERKRMIVDAMYDVANAKEKINKPGQLSKQHHKPSKPVKESESNTKPNQRASHKTTDGATPAKLVSSPDQSHKAKEHLPSSQPLKTEKELIERIHEAIKSKVGGKILSIQWIYIVDTGGQPQFHELLSAFIKNAAVCTFVLKLSERLDHHPLVEYWDSGENIGKPFPHPLSNLGIFKLCVHTIQSLPREGSECPVLLVIGTHSDELGQSMNETVDKNETLDDKNKILQQILSKNCNCIRNTEGVIFSVNAKTPQGSDRDLAKLLRVKISDLMPDPVNIPLRYYGLELELEHLANVKAEGKGILSLEECRRVGGRLSFGEEDLQAALNHLHKLNVVLYYPHILREVLFCDPLVVFNIVTKMIRYNYSLKHRSSNQTLLTTSLWQKSCETGLIEVNQVENVGEFKSCFQQKLFTPAHLFKLLEHLLIAALVKKRSQQYFMPSLLDELDMDKIVRPKSLHARLLITFYVDEEAVYAPAGLFSALVAFLLSSDNLDPKHGKPVAWILKDTDSSGKQYRNVVTLQSSSPPVKVMLINSNTMIEVFAKCAHNSLHDYLPKIKEVIKVGINKAKEARNFTHVTYKTTFVCKCSEVENETGHPANVHERHWSCPNNPELAGELDAKELVWLGEPLPAAPQITKQPKFQENISPGKSATFSVKADGQHLLYQWYHDDEPLISNSRVKITEHADTSILKIENAQPIEDEGYYQCTISNSTGGSVKTEPAALTTVPKIVEGPRSMKNLTPGESAEFCVNATGTNLAYSWHRQTAKHPLSNEKSVIMGNTQTLYIDKVESYDNGYYVCTISNTTGGSVQTNPVQLTTVPKITEEPQDMVNLTTGRPVDCSVVADGKDLTYVWHRQTTEQLLPNEKRVVVSTTHTLHINKVESSDEGFYVCTVSNPTGGSVESNPVHLTTIPKITEEPQDMENLTPGRSVDCSIVADGKDLTYVWHRQTAEQLLPNEKRVVVSTAHTLHINKVESSDEGFYVCTVSNPTGGSVESNTVRLTTKTVYRKILRNCTVYRAVPLVIVVAAILIAALLVWKPFHLSEDTHMEESHVFRASHGKEVIYKDGKPTLLRLMKFPGKFAKFNVVERIGSNYDTFGMFLLQDDDGVEVRALEHKLQRDSLQICKEILKLWLQGKGKHPVTYGTLVDCLRDAQLNTLANDIEDVLQ